MAIDGTVNGDFLEGTSGNDTINGFEGNDLMLGGEGNDLLDGGVGSDTMMGGNGNDRYVVDNVGDAIAEAPGGGYDVIDAYVDYTMPSGVEKMYLRGQAIQGRGNVESNYIVGNANNNLIDGLCGHDVLLGGAGNDTILGGDGNDYLSGGSGIDSLVGGFGNDRYRVDNSADVITESYAAGYDIVQSYANSYSLSANVEKMYLRGSALEGIGNSINNHIVGNSLSNTLSGNQGNDVLRGAGGDDTIFGGVGNDYIEGNSGNDSLIGGSDSDRYYFRLGDGIDRVNDISGDQDYIGIRSVNKNNIAFFQDASGNLVIDYGNVAGQDQVIVENVDGNAATNEVERIRLLSGDYLNENELNSIISAVNGFKSEGDVANVEDVKDNSELMTLIAGLWAS